MPAPRSLPPIDLGQIADDSARQIMQVLLNVVE